MPSQQLNLNIRVNKRQAERNLDSVNSRIDKMRNNVRKLNLAFTGFFGVLSGATAIRSTIDIFAKFERTMVTIGQVTGANEDLLNKLEKTALRVGRTTEKTLSQAAEGMLFLARTGFNAQEILDSFDAIVNASIASQSNLATVADVVSNTIKQFGLEASDATRVVDVMINTSNKANTTFLELAESLTHAAPLASAFGVDIEQLSAAVGKLADIGLRPEKIGTHLRIITQRLLLEGRDLSGPDGLIQVYRKLGEEINAIADQTERTEKLKDLFGSRAIGSGVNIVKYTEEIKALTDSNRNAAGSTETMARTIENTLEGSVKEFTSSIESLKEALGRRASDGLRGILAKLTTAFRNLADNTDPVLEAFKGIGAVLIGNLGIAAWRTFSGLVLGVASSFKSLVALNFSGLITNLGALTIAFKPLATVFGVISSGLLLFKETFKDSESPGIKRLGDSLQSLADQLNTLFDKIVPDFGSEDDTPLGRLAHLTSRIVDIFTGVLKVVNNILASLGKIWDAIFGVDEVIEKKSGEAAKAITNVVDSIEKFSFTRIVTAFDSST